MPRTPPVRLSTPPLPGTRKPLLVPQPAGYSGTPLAKKLGIQQSQRTWRSQMPESVAEEIASSGLQPTLLRKPEPGLEMAHIFVTRQIELAHLLEKLRPLLAAAGILWVSWPKKSSGVATDVTEDTIRAEALPIGFVDIKVCAVDATWSGLKLVIRRSERVSK